MLGTTREKLRLSVDRTFGRTATGKRDAEVRRHARRHAGNCYLVLGDSNTKTAALLSTRLAPVNAGFDGGTISTFLCADIGVTYARMARPAAVLIAVGLNEARASRRPAAFLSQYEELLDRLRGFNVAIVLTTPNPAFPLIDAYNDLMCGIASQRSVRTFGPFLDCEVGPDGVHYTEAGRVAWAGHLCGAAAAIASSPVVYG